MEELTVEQLPKSIQDKLSETIELNPAIKSLRLKLEKCRQKMDYVGMARCQHQMQQLRHYVEEEYMKPFCQWLDYKRERKEKYKTQKSIELAYSKMKKLSDNNPETAMMVIEESMANNWQGLFALKNNPPAKKGMNTGVILKGKPKYTEGW